MRKSTSGKLQRRNVTFPEAMLDEMAEVREKTGAQSDSEVLRRAFELYRHVIKNGGVVRFKEEDDTVSDYVA